MQRTGGSLTIRSVSDSGLAASAFPETVPLSNRPRGFQSGSSRVFSLEAGFESSQYHSYLARLSYSRAQETSSVLRTMQFPISNQRIFAKRDVVPTTSHRAVYRAHPLSTMCLHATAKEMGLTLESSSDVSRYALEKFRQEGNSCFAKLPDEAFSLSVINELSQLSDDPKLDRFIQTLVAMKEGLIPRPDVAPLVPQPPQESEQRLAISPSSPRLSEMDQAEVAQFLIETSVQGWQTVSEQQQQTSLDYGVQAAGNKDWALTTGLARGLEVAADLDAFIRAQKKKSAVEIIGRKNLTEPEPSEGSADEADSFADVESMIASFGLATRGAGSSPPPEALFTPDPTFRILEFLLEVDSQEEMRALMAEAFVPPSDAADTADSDEDLLYTTPLRLLQAIDLEIKNEQKQREAGTAGLLQGGQPQVESIETEDGSALDWGSLSREGRLRVLRESAWEFCL